MSWKLTVEEILQATQGEELSHFAGACTGVGTDTRKDLTSKIFIALRGENFDSHDFISEAVKKGAVILLIDKETEDLPLLKDKVTIIKVEDTLVGLQNLGHFWRIKNKAKVVAITGSNGKTTTKEFAAQILKSKFKVCYSQGSFNNHWGVPLSLLQITPDDQIAVIEMGMNHSGELTRLSEIAKPDIVLVTTVGPSHIGEVGSLDKIREAKQEIYKANPAALPIFNLDNESTLKMYNEFIATKEEKKKFLTFSGYKKIKDTSVGFTVTHLSLIDIEIQGHILSKDSNAVVRVFGKQNVVNLMAASAVALACGMKPADIWEAVSECRTTWGRNQLVLLKNGAHVLFDAYNANPQSMEALVKNIFEVDSKGKKVAIFGEMLELGPESDRYHGELGELVARSGFDLVWFIGQHGAALKQGAEAAGNSKNIVISDSYKVELAMVIGSMLSKQDVVIIKGSRGMKLEQVMEQWEAINF